MENTTIFPDNQLNGNRSNQLLLLLKQTSGLSAMLVDTVGEHQLLERQGACEVSLKNVTVGRICSVHASCPGLLKVMLRLVLRQERIVRTKRQIL